MIRYRLAAIAACIAATALLTGCASLDALAVAETHRLDGAPYYIDVAGAPPAPGTCAIVLPVSIDPRLTDVLGYERRESRLQSIVDALNARVVARAPCAGTERRDLNASVLGASSLGASSLSASSRGAPRVYVGTAASEFAPAEAADQALPTDRFPPMVLHLERPSDAWRRDASARAAATGARYSIVAMLGVSQYGKGYSGPFRKEVVLSTGHREPIRFLTSEDTPVEVLHLTGVLVDADGWPVRAGAEGVILRDTPFAMQVLGLAQILDDLSLERVVTDELRTDLPGSPLKLDVAFDNLLAQLTRSPPLVPAR
jgi:hypothetical protein